MDFLVTLHFILKHIKMKNGKNTDFLGNVCYYKDNQYHRTDGPAMEFVVTGSKWWYINGKCHREDGPAREYANGLKSWYLNGIEYSEEEYIVELRKIKLKRLMELLKGKRTEK